MTASASVNRRLPNFLKSFLQYSDAVPSPELFRKWAAIGVLSAALEKKVWARTKGSNLYPNLYTILVGPPGVGKSQILYLCEHMLRAVTDIKVAPSSLTTASLIDALNGSVRKFNLPDNTPIQFNSMQIIASELGVFLPHYDPAFMNTLTKLYDGELYEERRRTGKVNHIRIDSTQLSILGGTTPGYLHTFLPDGAWDQGFTSRTLFVFSDEETPKEAFEKNDEEERNEVLCRDLIHDLKIVAKFYGKVAFTDDAKQAISEWDAAKLPPVPLHGKLLHYNSRRFAHTIKLSIAACVARGDCILQVTKEDFVLARSWLLEAESLMPEIFRAIGVGGDAKAMQDLYYVVQDLHRRTNVPVQEHILVGFLKDRIPSSNINKVLETMVRSQDLQLVKGMNGVPAYIPWPKAKGPP